MNTAELIANLSTDLKPVRVAHRPLRTALLTFVVYCAFAATTLAVLGAREMTTVRFPHFWLGEVAILVVLLATSIYSAITLRYPAAEHSHPWRPVIAVLSAWGVYLLAGMITIATKHGIHELIPVDGISCAGSVFALCLIPAATLLVVIKRGYPTAPAWTTFSIMIAAGSVAVLGIEFHCTYENAAHHLSYHLGPVLLLAAAGLAWGRRALKHAPPKTSFTTPGSSDTLQAPTRS